MTGKRFRVFKFLDCNKWGVSDDIAEVTVAFCDKEVEADYLCDLLNNLHDENVRLKKEINGFITNVKYTAKLSADIITEQWSNNDYTLKTDLYKR